MKLKNTITDIFFDLDHTLWDFERNSALAFEAILGEHFSEVNLHDFLQIYVPLNFEYWERYRKDEISQQELRIGRIRDTFQKLNIAITSDEIEILSEAYIENLPKYNHLFDGAFDLLDYLKANYKLHIITNGFEIVQGRKIDNSKIGHYFTTITNSEMAGVKKPNPIIFEHALKISGANKSQSIMIGDCIDADIRGALNFGMDAILFCVPDVSYDGIKHVNHLSEIKNYL